MAPSTSMASATAAAAMTIVAVAGAAVRPVAANTIPASGDVATKPNVLVIASIEAQKIVPTTLSTFLPVITLVVVVSYLSLYELSAPLLQYAKPKEEGHRHRPRNLRTLRQFATIVGAVALDFVCYRLLLSPILSTEASRIPSILTYTSAFGLLCPRPYARLTNRTSNSVVRKREEVFRLVFNALLFAGVIVYLRGSLFVGGYPAALQFNSIVSYQPYSNSPHLQANTLYSKITIDDDMVLFSSPLSCRLSSETPPISNSLFNASTTTTLHCAVKANPNTFVEAAISVAGTTAAAFLWWIVLLAHNETISVDQIDLDFFFGPTFGIAISLLVLSLFFNPIIAILSRPPLRFAWCPKSKWFLKTLEIEFYVHTPATSSDYN
ncbi:hypothetical protein DFJ73DRAFT_942886 [Zopfochytrium polystomum]|nr:hypothetical protein DFJ73DRAFT_942886 [Zopfochytrium polystomum]